uniref:Uncharacterized protein n=1 Tax=Nicotiana tabacum TaxID=4097 RepID=A0A1S3XCC8_TOBAC|nr:PREDICTED: uncharacterized protein LOC107763584 [Nicotiana tabacum]
MALPGLLRLEWRGLDYIPSRVMSFLKAHRMVEKRCEAYLAFVRDVSANTPTVELVSRPLALDVQALANQLVRLDDSEPSCILACVVSRSSLYERIKACRYDDPHLLVLKNTVQYDNAKEVTIGDDGALWMQSQICVPNVIGLRVLILEEAHILRNSIHPVFIIFDQGMQFTSYFWCSVS